MKQFKVETKSYSVETAEWDEAWDSGVFEDPFEAYFKETAEADAVYSYFDLCVEDYNWQLSHSENPPEPPEHLEDSVAYNGKKTIFRATELPPCVAYSTKLETIRHQMGMTQKELSEKSGIKQSNISDFEVGKRNLLTARVETLMRLAEALHCQVEDLI
ncbi:MAG: helix-turn-helix domain-containing protein [Ruminiclostridium sp.]